MGKQITLTDFVQNSPESDKDNCIYVVDIETTSTRPYDGSIVEIGICELNLETGNVKCIFDEIVREDGFNVGDRNAWIFSNSDLTYKEVLAAPRFGGLIEKLQEIFERRPSTAYNKRFDFGWLRSRGLKILELPCPMIAATPIIRLPPVFEDHDFKYPKVEEAWDYYYPDLDYVEKHRAYDDAEHEAMIVYAMYKSKHWEPVIRENAN